MNELVQLLVEAVVVEVDMYEYDPGALTAYGFNQTGGHSYRCQSLSSSSSALGILTLRDGTMVEMACL